MDAVTGSKKLSASDYVLAKICYFYGLSISEIRNTDADQNRFFVAGNNNDWGSRAIKANQALQIGRNMQSNEQRCTELLQYPSGE